METFMKIVDNIFKSVLSNADQWSAMILSYICFALFIGAVIFLWRFIIMTPSYLKRIAIAMEERNRIEENRYRNQNAPQNTERKVEPINPNDIVGTPYTPNANQKKNDSIFTRDIKDIFKK